MFGQRIDGDGHLVGTERAADAEYRASDADEPHIARGATGLGLVSSNGVSVGTRNRQLAFRTLLPRI